MPPVTSDRTHWTDTELDASVRAYLDMLRMDLDGTPFKKSHVIRALRGAELSGRSKGSAEYRMQNISALVFEMGIPFVRGYPPAMQVGTSMRERIRPMLFAHGVQRFQAYIPTADRGQLDVQVSALRRQPMGREPRGNVRPPAVTTTSTSFVRDPAVKAWVLQAANGMCEGCSSPAPFTTMEGLPYLEVHHVMPLAALGSDTVGNAVALCPNCHRRCHHAADRHEFKLHLYETVKRLRIEVAIAGEPDIGDRAELEDD